MDSVVYVQCTSCTGVTRCIAGEARMEGNMNFSSMTLCWREKTEKTPYFSNKNIVLRLCY